MKQGTNKKPKNKIGYYSEIPSKISRFLYKTYEHISVVLQIVFLLSSIIKLNIGPLEDLHTSRT